MIQGTIVPTPASPPLASPVDRPRPGGRLFSSCAARVLRDPRDRPLLATIRNSALFAVFGLILLVRKDAPSWLSLPYLAVFVRLLGPFVLMEHQLVHRRLFRPRSTWIERAVVWVLNPFFGQTFSSYGAHHIGMHHVEENGPTDLSSTRAYQRDSWWDFIRYLARFFVTANLELPRYFRQKNRLKLYRRVLAGEWVYVTLLAAGFAFNPWGAFVVWVAPLLIARFAMISGNWAQHAFVDPTRPEQASGFSISCVDTPYNALCFNDGYHIEHHENPSAHWSDLPRLHLENRERLEREKAIVFRGLDYFQIWWKLMRRDYTGLALAMDSLRDWPVDERVELLRSRLQRWE